MPLSPGSICVGHARERRDRHVRRMRCDNALANIWLAHVQDTSVSKAQTRVLRELHDTVPPQTP